MSAADQAAELRARAEAFEEIGKLEEKAAAAKQAYQADNTDPKLKAKHRAASQALTDARVASRGGDVTVTPDSASANGKAQG